MPKKMKPKSFKKARARELERMAQILLDAKLCSNTNLLWAAASQCRENSGSIWSYEVKELEFPLSYFRHPIPSQVKEVLLSLTIKVSGDSNRRFDSDPFRTLEFNIVIEGQREDESECLCSWHLDRDEPSDSDGVQEFVHPCYHLQYGGRQMRTSGLDFGASLILESPRIAHPPMDAILGIDFVLTNFFSSSVLGDFRKGEYANLVRAAQERIWRPYALALAANWTKRSERNAWRPSQIWPQLILSS